MKWDIRWFENPGPNRLHEPWPLHRVAAEKEVPGSYDVALADLDRDGDLDVTVALMNSPKDIPEEDLNVLGFHEWQYSLERGFAAHHAGLLPAFKEAIEALFQKGLVKAVFATETLALGINMPAKTVLLDRLSKWNGESHVNVTPGEYTQLTGRAGRRGLDTFGNAIILWSQEIDSHFAASLANTRTYPLRSSFRPTYNMSINLVGQMGKSRAKNSLSASFAQFQADKAVVNLEVQRKRNLQALETLSKEMQCGSGDAMKYATIKNELRDDIEKLNDTKPKHDVLVGVLQSLLLCKLIHDDDDNPERLQILSDTPLY